MPAYEARIFDPPAPLAYVALRDPDTGRTLPDVPMLIDSGADVTLVPERAVKSLGRPFEPGAGCELAGFDGTTTVAKVVRLEVSLQQWTFRGRYLGIDQPWGILGRNVLNNLSIILDGPNLTWRWPA